MTDAAPSHTAPWLKPILDDPVMNDLRAAIDRGGQTIVRRACGSLSHMLPGILASQCDRPMLHIVAHLDEVDEALDDLMNLANGSQCVALPAMETVAGDAAMNLDLLAERLDAVAQLNAGEQPPVMVAPVQALMQAVPDEQAMQRSVLVLERGAQWDLSTLANWLGEAGYQRVDAVEMAGDFAIRGGIVDIYAAGGLPPVRIDFFGDQIDSIHEIDTESLGSQNTLERVRILAAEVDALLDPKHTVPLWEKLADHTAVVFRDWLEIAEQARGYYERLTDEHGIYPPAAVMKGLGRFPWLRCESMPSGAGDASAEAIIELPARPLTSFSHDARAAVRELISLTEQPEAEVRVVCDKPAERDRLEQMLAEHEQLDASRLDLVDGRLEQGFSWRDQRWIIIPHGELFHRYTRSRRIRKVSAPTRINQGFLDLVPDDYVVHADHGIAIFRGLRTMRRENKPAEEYLTLEFADRALLHVPATQIELVQKYVGGFSGKPTLSKLGGKSWSRQKAQVQDAVKDLAKELLQVQAARAATPGQAHPEDTTWMKQFEAEFEYQETEDQVAAIAAVKRDLQRVQPMDRLICGDVGYGKTEVAMRAAFKVIEGGKQVAVLCPTTVLCEQHERTFRSRMADYPFRIESVSRFKTLNQAREILEATARGEVDVLIGTHRLLSADVNFADLGLIVIDEEQRFGVEHKNRLMRFRMTVDVMTMSATPIPRTLHMALLGLRDISSLSTPPADRRAVQTEVLSYDRERIKMAIHRELNRDGQVFFVHNRVHDLESVADDIQKLVPDARVIWGHGQMSPRELEKIMLKFVRHEADVLVCTTIIESGIDIPSANTMFIDQADLFGLAELHQLRGRVGRYKHRAYCYLLLPEDRPLTDIAAKRLRAIEQYAMLGAGFKIAMRDMEIRGVGNIIGPEQSGHIATVGYDMYCRMLERATRQLKADSPTPTLVEDAQIDLGIAGQIPRKFIPSDKLRMQCYRRVAAADELSTLEEIHNDMTQAFGDLPDAVQKLIELAELRVVLTALNVRRLHRMDQDLIFSTFDVRPVYELLDGAAGSVRLVDVPEKDKPGTVYYRPPENYFEGDTLLRVLHKRFVSPSKVRGSAEAEALASR